MAKKLKKIGEVGIDTGSLVISDQGYFEEGTKKTDSPRCYVMAMGGDGTAEIFYDEENGCYVIEGSWTGLLGHLYKTKKKLSKFLKNQ